MKIVLRLHQPCEQMPEPEWVISMGQYANSAREFYDRNCTVQNVDTVVLVNVYIPGCPPLIRGLLNLREQIEEHAESNEKEVKHIHQHIQPEK